MGSFSDSPGAIYPALRRLERKGFVKSQQQASSGRRRQIVTLTSRGTAELNRWVALPVTQREIMSGLREFMLRFALSEAVIGAEVSADLLRGLEKELKSVVGSLREQANILGPRMPRSSALALESGIMGHETLLRWCKQALSAYGTVNSASQ